MPDRPRRGAALLVALTATATFSASAAQAAPFGAPETATLALVLGSLFVAVVSSVALLRARQRLADVTAATSRDAAD
ncbi:hypothetical protein ACFQ4O_12730, partial [Methylopila musalis]